MLRRGIKLLGVRDLPSGPIRQGDGVQMSVRVTARRWSEARNLQKLSLAEAAQKIGITAEALTAIETVADLSGVTEDQLRLAASLYDVSIGFLQGR
jgi:DNA-binding XRE family transcriptional regulator